MGEVVKKLHRMLGQAQQFAAETPLEAVARAKLAVKEAEAALRNAAGAEREQIDALRRMAATRVEKYEAEFAAWNGEVRERAHTFVEHEHERLQQAIPAKV